MSGRNLILSLDIGAGSGSKLGLFKVHEGDFILLGESEISYLQYQSSYDKFISLVLEAFSLLLASMNASWIECMAGGISSAGLLSSSGSYLKLNNIPFLQGKNLPSVFMDKTGVPWSIANDANCGGLAEWIACKHELLYWVLGGGWGGSWINTEGKVMFPSLDWSGIDKDLSPADEPGYATPLYKNEIVRVFNQYGMHIPEEPGLFDEWMKIERDPQALELVGPGGDPGSIRSEFLVSGPGRHRIFSLCNRQHDLDTEDVQTVLASQGQAGVLISKLRDAGNLAAIRTDLIFGTLLGLAGARILDSSIKNGLAPNSPVILAGKPALAHEGFLNQAMKILEDKGITNPLKLSNSLETGRNPNLLGAAVSAWKALES